MTGQFSEYIKTLLTVSVICFLCESITDLFSSGKALSRGISLISSLCIFITVLFPLSGVMNSCRKEFEFPKSESQNMAIDNNLFKKFTEKELESLVTSEITKKIGIYPEYVSIELSVSDDSIRTKQIIIGLNPKDAEKAKETMAFIKAAFGPEVQVFITKG